MFTKKTLRKMANLPQTRKVAEAVNDMELATRRLKKLLPVIQHMEMKSKAMTEQTMYPKGQPVDEEAEIAIKPTKPDKDKEAKSEIQPVGWEEIENGSRE